MKNQESWQETRFIYTNGNIEVNRKAVSQKSWIINDCVARIYSKHLPNFVNGKLLDLGCGMCPFYKAYYEYSSSIFCIDWENSLHSSPYVDLHCDLNKMIPVADNSFDTIILSDVLEHIQEPSTLLREAYRLLDTNGVILINVPFFYWIHEQPYDFYRYTEFGLKQILDNAGFKVEVFEVVGGILETWSDLTSKLSSYLPFLSLIIPKLLYLLIILANKIVWLKNKRSFLDRLFPLGYFIVARKL